MAESRFDAEDASPLEAKETARKLPAGWLVLFCGLVAWGAYYLWTYSPALGGWSQARELDGAPTSSGVTLFATVLFTALAAIAAVAIILAVARRRRP